MRMNLYLIISDVNGEKRHMVCTGYENAPVLQEAECQVIGRGGVLIATKKRGSKSFDEVK